MKFILLCTLLVSTPVWTDLHNRIINGKDAVAGDFPYQVLIKLKNVYNKEIICGGSLIHKLYILTAAHCVANNNGENVPVESIIMIAGQVELEVSNLSISRNAKNVIIHEKYDSNTLANDIAIIKVTEPFPNKGFVNIIQLNTIPVTSGKCIISGWGLQDFYSSHASNVLQYATVSIIEFSKCKEMLIKCDSRLIVSDQIICANDIDNESDSCKGDSGGPLVCQKRLVGLVSWGYKCGLPECPGVYTDIQKYLDWIKDKVPLTIGEYIHNEL